MARDRQRCLRLPRPIGQSRALDLILTGRRAGAAKAWSIGHANRVASGGKSKHAAVELARQLAGFPQTRLRNDLRSVKTRWDVTE